MLVADAAVRRELRAAFIADRRTAASTPGFAPIPPSAVAAVSPRTVFYAFDQATGIYWATASFSPTAAATQTAAAIGFQDGGNEAVFDRSGGTAWRVESVGQCLTGLPLAVATATGQVSGPNPMCRSGIPAR